MPADVGQFKAQLVRGDDGDADRRGLEHGLESHARVDLGAGQLFRRAVAVLRDAGEAVNVRRRPDALGHGLRELHVLGVEGAAIVGARQHHGADAVAV